MAEQRADARRNRERILEVAHTVVTEQGTDASLRDVARRAGIGLGTLYRHFATREALLEALVGARFTRLGNRAAELGAQEPPGVALETWLREFVAGAGAYRGLSSALMATQTDPQSPLHVSCDAMRAAVATLLAGAQRAGHVRPDVDGADVFALVSALSWVVEQAPAVAERRDHLFRLVMDGLLITSVR
jgi:AcrR family transcriptional regulator